MGTYLSTPVLEKDIDSGEDLNDASSTEGLSVSWSCVEMQGWRKNMEDAHIAEVSLRGPGWLAGGSGMEEESGRARVFGAFDGHGGAEVARFCREHFVNVLVNREEWAQGDVGKALAETFFQLDRMVDDPSSHAQLLLLKTLSKGQGQGGQPSTAGPPQEDSANSDNNNHSLGDADMTETQPSSRITETDAMHILERLVKNAAAIPPVVDNVPPTELPPQQQEDQSPLLASPPNSSMTLTNSPSRMVNGRQVCNLPDHPIHAGCTSIVCVLSGHDTLTVANAGDSRIVLCRNKDHAMPLSTDHKPNNDNEMQRIQLAGGFVNHFGRVNGNLNVSRSIGDLKYKQTAGIAPNQQMITADPDILQISLLPDDEFIIIGCDGIWDCLTNQECVDFVRQRIDTTPLCDIGVAMLDSIVSEDPRASQGIGGDNMTCLIVDLKSKQRRFRSTSISDNIIPPSTYANSTINEHDITPTGTAPTTNTEIHIQHNQLDTPVNPQLNSKY